MKKCEVDLKKSGCSEQSRKAEATRDFRYDCENFATIAKISLCENFARLVKFR